MKKRIYFNKYGDMKYISHLDLIRFIERLFKKTGIEMKYSQGFHPRPKMSFLNPISLGTEAYNEPMEIDLITDLTNEAIRDRLNAENISGFSVKRVEDADELSLSEAFSSINYIIKGSKEHIEQIYSLLSCDEIIETKEKKGKMVSRNLKERIIEMKINQNEILITLDNMSPNSFLNILKIELQDIEIIRTGYNGIKERIC